VTISRFPISTRLLPRPTEEEIDLGEVVDARALSVADVVAIIEEHAARGIIVSATEPENPQEGDIWLDISNST
jgi:hypothetical protein